MATTGTRFRPRRSCPELRRRVSHPRPTVIRTTCAPGVHVDRGQSPLAKSRLHHVPDATVVAPTRTVTVCPTVHVGALPLISNRASRLFSAAFNCLPHVSSVRTVPLERLTLRTSSLRSTPVQAVVPFQFPVTLGVRALRRAPRSVLR